MTFYSKKLNISSNNTIKGDNISLETSAYAIILVLSLAIVFYIFSIICKFCKSR